VLFFLLSLSNAQQHQQHQQSDVESDDELKFTFKRPTKTVKKGRKGRDKPYKLSAGLSHIVLCDDGTRGT